MSETRKAWAIRIPSGFIGVGWFGWPDQSHLLGLPVALFPTRREARSALVEVQGPAERGRFPTAKVVRVRVDITEAKP